MALEFEVKDAQRETVPILICMYSPTGAGKTFSGLLVASGLAGPNGQVGMVDAENKRGSLYADDPDIIKAMPGGRYKIVDLSAPYSPARYIKALKALEAAGCTVALVDSTSHEWSGEDGCCDIAEKNKMGGFPNWAKAKLEHKRFMAYCLSSPMSIIFCLRAHEKVKPVKAGELVSPDSTERYDKAAVIPLGMLPDTEKNLVFEAMLSFCIEDGTHLARPVKVPKMLAHIFPGKKLLSKADGDAVRLWNEGAAKANNTERTLTRARLAAEEGAEAYKQFFTSLSPAQKKALAESPDHAENKKIADQADREAPEVAALDDPAAHKIGDAFRYQGKVWTVAEVGGAPEWVAA